MKIAPLKTSDPWYGRIVNNDEIDSDTLSGVPIETTVEMELVELLHGDAESNYRPYLHLRGELTSAVPAVALPYGVDELALRSGAGVPVDAFYDFSHKQLADLVAKGYFSPAFQVPEAMSGIPWNLPGKADFLVVAPELADEAPLVFMRVHDQNSMALDEVTSGYELTAYFPDVVAEAEAQVDVDHVGTAQAQIAVDAALDVFADVNFDVDAPTAVTPVLAEESAAARAVVPDGVFSRLLAEIEERHAAVLPAAPTEAEAEEGVVPGSAEDVYLSRIAPGVDHVFTEGFAEEDEFEQVPQADDSGADDAAVESEAIEEPADAESYDLEGYLDLAATSAPTVEDHLKAVQQREARLRAVAAGEQHVETEDEAQADL